MSDQPCPFCDPQPAERIFYEDELTQGLWDGFPVSPGHALIVPRRHVSTWFDATAEEQGALMRALSVARDIVAERHRPDGYNVGINVGEAAGQTVFHLHVHLIPRYSGDVADPRGGVRHVIPSKGNYLLAANTRTKGAPGESHRRALVSGGEDDPLLPHLLANIDESESLDMAVAFVLPSGVRRIEPRLRDLLARGGSVRLLTGDYMDVTDPDALLRLLDLEGRLELRVFETRGTSFHPKAYIFRRRGERESLTSGALT